MTVLVALDHLSLDDRVTIPPAAARVGESSIGLRAGQRVPVRDLVIGALVPSANDAATALAIASSGSVPRFVQAMNRKAARLGLARTRYANPHGLDQAGHVSTAVDSAALLRAALRVPVIRRYVGTHRATLSDGRVVDSTDNLLGVVPGFLGGKTGHTALAGWSQVGFARRDGVGITATVLGSPTEAQRDRDLAALLRFGLASYRPSRVVDSDRTYARVEVGWGRPALPLVAPRSIVRPASTARPLVERVVAPVVAALPIRAGQRLGTVVVTDGSRVVARSPLVASRAEPAPTFAQQARWVAGRAIVRLAGLVS
jgi:D-alanyl-D-alanine carboxypeptidase